jgi:hypothetical protein
MRCDGCGNNRLSIVFLEEALKLDSLTFKSILPAKICSKCNQAYFDIKMRERFDILVAKWLANHAIISPKSFKFMREVCKLTRPNLSNLFNVPMSKIDNWESGTDFIEWYYVALLGSLVLDELGIKISILDRLKAFRQSPINNTEIFIKTIEMVD